MTILLSYVQNIVYLHKPDINWKERFLAREFEGLNDVSKRPKKSPQKLSEETVLEIIRIKNNKKHWGSRKIRVIYESLHPGKTAPSCRIIDRILHKAGLIQPKICI